MRKNNIVLVLCNKMQICHIYKIFSRRGEKVWMKVLIKFCFLIQAEITVADSLSSAVPTCTINSFYLIELFHPQNTQLNN